MSYIEKTCWCNPANYGGGRNLSAIKYIVIHYTGNDGDTDESNALYFHNNVLTGNRLASAHDFVDDDSVTHSVAHDHVAYHCGTSGRYFHPYCRNSNSIGIEMCDTVRDGVYALSAKTRANAIAYVATLMRKYNIPIDRVVRHYDVTHKQCPAYFVNEARWANFKSELEDELMDGKEMYEKINSYLANLPLPDWHNGQPAGELQEAIDLGITDGTRPMQLIPRYQAAIMCLRAVKAARKNG